MKRLIPYYRARYYSPQLGRFISRDPIGEMAGTNLYTYVDNNAINAVDPSGLCCENEQKTLDGIEKALKAETQLIQTLNDKLDSDASEITEDAAFLVLATADAIATCGISIFAKGKGASLCAAALAAEALARKIEQIETDSSHSSPRK